ncbi:hypothetical protein [Enterobacter bugandensis]|uniref:hypothetical protein n=1 Tax=Enterobacter bugandensis TaxID=881260 RepID=UPI002D77F8B8|nr:hypothetical protein [Enterobacter bugandensis]WRT51509.1 hypothetical protein VK758_23180 [Enterobacter bugandensis]
MSIKNLVEMIKHNGLLASISQLEELYRVAIDNEQKLADSEAKCAALAAENAGLKDETSNITFMRDDDFFGSTQRAQEVMGRLVNVKTPATDAFLAEVRAQARNEIIDELEARFTELSQTSPTSDLRSGAAGAAAVISTFRKGVQS